MSKQLNKSYNYCSIALVLCAFAALIFGCGSGEESVVKYLNYKSPSCRELVVLTTFEELHG
jgi:hypothetical protein